MQLMEAKNRKSLDQTLKRQVDQEFISKLQQEIQDEKLNKLEEKRQARELAQKIINEN